MAARATTVAIWGSCVTRDAFALDVRTAELAERLPLRHYAARSSWISQSSAPWPDRDAELAGPVSEWGRRMVADDLDKTIVDHLIEQQPDLLVFDLIDERLSVCRSGPIWFTCRTSDTDPGVRAQAEAEETPAPTDPRRPPLPAARHTLAAGCAAGCRGPPSAA
jgi:hypothetical protein